MQRRLGSWAGGGSPSSALQHRCAGRLRRGWRRTCSSATWTWASSTGLSPLHSDGTAVRRAAAHDGAALEAARTQSSVVMEGERAWSSLLPRWWDGGQTRQPGSCARWPRHEQRRCLSSCRAGQKPRGSDAGVPFWRAAQQGGSPCRCWNSDLRWGRRQFHLCKRCCAMTGLREQALSSILS